MVYQRQRGDPAMSELYSYAQSTSPGIVQNAERLLASKSPEYIAREINKIDPIDGYTPLHIAIHKGQKEMVNFLLEQGADLNMQTQYGTASERWLKLRTPIHLAMTREVDRGDHPYNTSLQMLKHLLDHGADPNEIINKYDIFRDKPFSFWDPVNVIARQRIELARSYLPYALLAAEEAAMVEADVSGEGVKRNKHKRKTHKRKTYKRKPHKTHKRKTHKRKTRKHKAHKRKT